MTLILDGKRARAALAARLKERISKLSKRPVLAIIQVGNREESSAYIKSKTAFSQDIGAEVVHIKFPELASETEIIDRIKSLNDDKNINGILVQLPISENLPKEKIINSIDPKKDVDGLTDVVAKARAGGDRNAIMPATARGVMELLEFYKIRVTGKKVAVLGRSILAGAPIKEAIIFAGGMTTVCHSNTPIEEEIKTTKESDIIIVAIGKPKFLTTEFFTAGANQVVVDVGINRMVSGEVLRGQTSNFGRGLTSLKLQEEIPQTKFVGDVDFENVAPMVSAITPVPGGVGQMTVLALFENLFDSIQKSF